MSYGIISIVSLGEKYKYILLCMNVGYAGCWSENIVVSERSLTIVIC